MDIRTGTPPKRKKTKSQLDWKFCLLEKVKYVPFAYP